MTALLLHSTEELRLINFQKELILKLNETDSQNQKRIFYRQIPLWIELGDFDISKKNIIKSVEFGQTDFSKTQIFIDVKVSLNDSSEINTKLPLINLLRGSDFFELSPAKSVLKIKQPVNQLKVFRLGIVKELSPVAKCISDSKWCKLK